MTYTIHKYLGPLFIFRQFRVAPSHRNLLLISRYYTGILGLVFMDCPSPLYPNNAIKGNAPRLASCPPITKPTPLFNPQNSSSACSTRSVPSIRSESLLLRILFGSVVVVVVVVVVCNSGIELVF